MLLTEAVAKALETGESVVIDEVTAFPPEFYQDWNRWLEQKRESEMVRQADLNNILVGWSSPTGLIRYARPEA